MKHILAISEAYTYFLLSISKQPESLINMCV